MRSRKNNLTKATERGYARRAHGETYGSRAFVPRRNVAVSVVAAALLAHFARACFAAAPAEVAAEFDFRPRGDLVTAQVDVAGRRCPFVLDTGSSHWVLDDSLRPLLGPATGRVAMDISRSTDLFRMPPVRVGSMQVAAGAEVICAPLHDDGAPLGADVYGILPMRFLRGKIFQIDFDRGKVVFLSAVPEDAGQRFPVTWLDNRRPLLEIDVPGFGKERFLIDTGCRTFTTGMLRKQVFEQLAARGRIRPMSNISKSGASLVSLGGTTSTRSGRIDRFNVGRFSHERLIFGHCAVEGPAGFSLPSVYEGSLLGLGYLCRYVVTFDFALSAIYLKPGRDYARQDRYNLAGMGVARVEGKTVVTNVDEHATAEAAGLKEADEILEIDGIPTAKASVFEIGRTFATPGERKLRYLRKANDSVEERAVTLVLTEADEEAAFGTDPPGTGREGSDSSRDAAR